MAGSTLLTVALWVLAIAGTVWVLIPVVGFLAAYARGGPWIESEFDDHVAKVEPGRDDPDYAHRYAQFVALGFRPVGFTRQRVRFASPIHWEWRSRQGSRWMSSPDGRTLVSFFRLIADEPVRFRAATLCEDGAVVRTSSPGGPIEVPAGVLPGTGRLRDGGFAGGLSSPLARAAGRLCGDGSLCLVPRALPGPAPAAGCAGVARRGPSRGDIGADGQVLDSGKEERTLRVLAAPVALIAGAYTVRWAALMFRLPHPGSSVGLDPLMGWVAFAMFTRARGRLLGGQRQDPPALWVGIAVILAVLPMLPKSFRTRTDYAVVWTAAAIAFVGSRLERKRRLSRRA